MKITESKLRTVIKKVINESRYMEKFNRAKPHVGSDQSLFYWLRQNYRKGFSIDMYALEPVRTSNHVLDLMDTEPALSGLKVIGQISNTVPGAATYLFRDGPDKYVVLHVYYDTGRGIIAKDFGYDYDKLAEIVNYMIKRKKPAPNPEIDKYISAF